MKNISLVILLVFTSSILSAQTGQVGNSAIKSQIDQEDFESKVQRPFSTAYQTFKDQINELSGSEHNAMGFLSKIPDTLNPIDSLKAALCVQIYKNASVTYRIATIEWICAHTDSLKSPRLIQAWWPRSGWGLIYSALSNDVKKSKWGQILKSLIENSEQETKI